MNLKEMIKNDVHEVIKDSVAIDKIVIESPKDRTKGDYAIPCFVLAKELSKNPFEIATMIKNNINSDNYELIEVVGGYLNLFVKKDVVLKYVLDKVLTERENYGRNHIGDGKTVVIDYSAPNIAKPFGIGHLRSTVIGNSLKRICRKNGYTVVGINYLGDWGTQFGKLISAYKRWGNEEEMENNPINELKRLYVKFHAEAELDEALNDEGRMYFRMLEQGDPEVLRLWKWFKDESLLEFNKTYDLLGINDFESYNGEAFYNDKMQPIVDELDEKNLLVESKGALVVEIGENLNPALIKKTDGSTLYITRDIAAANYRKDTYNFDEALYVVGNEQTLHFTQLKKVLEKMGRDWYNDIHHINFGMVLQGGKKMSTRKGRAVKLHDVLVEAVEMAAKYIEERTPDLENKEQVSKQIGVGAVIYNDLKNYRINDIEFNLEDTIRFEGETGPYIQYTYARINSLLTKKSNIDIDYTSVEINELIWNLVFKLYEFNDIILKAKETYDPSLVAKYVMSLAQDFNKFYAHEKIIDEDLNAREFKLSICESVSIVIKECLSVLGIDAPEKM